MIESEGALGMGKVGKPIDAYLVPSMDYSGWWATQTWGPLGGLVEGDVYYICSFYFIYWLFTVF